jgi:hypothetical protein
MKESCIWALNKWSFNSQQLCLNRREREQANFFLFLYFIFSSFTSKSMQEDILYRWLHLLYVNIVLNYLRHHRYFLSNHHQISYLLIFIVHLVCCHLFNLKKSLHHHYRRLFHRSCWVFYLCYLFKFVRFFLSSKLFFRLSIQSLRCQRRRFNLHNEQITHTHAHLFNTAGDYKW